MSLFSELPPKTFNLLSIGQRGVGKTVFLAGSYAQLQNAPVDLAFQGAATSISSSKLPREPRSANPSSWVECQDEKVQANLQKILSHVEKTGSYPPATIKITNFDFQLKHRVRSTIKTLCNFQWWDIPGEACNLRNEEFQQIVLNSHGCCVFISAAALVQEQDYVHSLKDIFNQVLAIASVVSHHQLNYAVAIILTKCDLLESGTEMQAQLERRLEPLTTRLDAVKVNYRLFHSAIPIITTNGSATLDVRGAADPLLWLLSVLSKHHRFQPERSLATHLTEKSSPRRLLVPRWAVILAVISLSVVGVGTSLWLGRELWKPPTQEQRSQ
ncbi:hypothetical protein H6F89_23345 [Cyanobacteria bacterium FACHB-63]|nr:hypothetical protein [Cyanobacteria bacterium FACHB-63]